MNTHLPNSDGLHPKSNREWIYSDDSFCCAHLFTIFLLVIFKALAVGSYDHDAMHLDAQPNFGTRRLESESWQSSSGL